MLDLGHNLWLVILQLLVNGTINYLFVHAGGVD